MSEGRERILSAVRQSLGRNRTMDAEELRQARARDLERYTAPRQRWDSGTRGRFTRCLEEAAATWATVNGAGEVAAAAAEYLDRYDLPHALAAAPHPLLAGITWPEGWSIVSGKPARDTRAGLSFAYAGVAETGTLAMLSGPHSPITLNYLPEFHLVVLKDADIVDYYEDLWLRARAEPDFPPRAVNLITGPSRTADVEQTLQLGAHGPKQLHVIILLG